jgi:hypothetical protein
VPPLLPQLAALALALLMGVQTALQAGLPFAVAMVLTMAAWACPAFVVLRHGLLALCSTIFYLAVVVDFPLTLEPGHWTGLGSVLALLTAVGIAVLSFHASLAGRPLLRDDLLEG